MKAYGINSFDQNPDVADINEQGRKSSVGRFDQRGYFKNKSVKRQIRRRFKRVERQRAKREIKKEIE